MNTASNTETVFVVDDDPSVCDAIRDLLESVGLKTQHFGSTEEFLSAFDDASGCLILDVRLPGMSGIEFQQKLAAARIAIPIIIMTAHGDIQMVRKVMRAGAIEFLTKPFQKEELLAAIHDGFAIDRARRSAMESNRSIQKRYESLTVREREVMQLVTLGFLNKQVAERLRVSEITVKLHRRHVMEKMQAKSIAALVRMSEHISRFELPFPIPSSHDK